MEGLKSDMPFGAEEEEAAEKKKDESLIKSAFRLFDTKNAGIVPAADLPKIMRAAGLNPSNKEIEDLLKQLPEGHNDSLTRSDIWSLVENREKESGSMLLSALRIFDRDHNGYVSVEELKHRLTSTGEKLNAEEIEELISFADVHHEGKIDLESFAKLISPKPISSLRSITIKEPVKQKTSPPMQQHRPSLSTLRE